MVVSIRSTSGKEAFAIYAKRPSGVIKMSLAESPEIRRVVITELVSVSGVTAISPGSLSTGMVAMFVCATVSRTEMLAERASEIKALSRSGVISIRIG